MFPSFPNVMSSNDWNYSIIHIFNTSDHFKSKRRVPTAEYSTGIHILRSTSMNVLPYSITSVKNLTFFGLLFEPRESLIWVFTVNFSILRLLIFKKSCPHLSLIIPFGRGYPQIARRQ